jgi:type III secretion protein HrpB1
MQGGGASEASRMQGDGADATALARAVADHIREGRIDEAESMLARLHECCPASRDVLAFPVMIALQRGRVHDAWQLVNGLPDEQCPELKALCLRMLGDPLWHGYASAHADSPNPTVRRAMRQLLGREAETNPHAETAE